MADPEEPGTLSAGSELVVHLRLPIIAPLTREQAYADSAAPLTYCGRSRVPRGLSAAQLKDVEALAQTLGAEVCPSCLEAKSDEARVH